MGSPFIYALCKDLVVCIPRDGAIVWTRVKPEVSVASSHGMLNRNKHFK